MDQNQIDENQRTETVANRILALSNTLELIQRVRAALEPEGYVVTVEAYDASVVEAVARHKPAVVILAAGAAVVNTEAWTFERGILESLGGYSNSTRPGFFVLTSRRMDSYLGAPGDIYLREEFNPLELLAFVRRVIRSLEDSGTGSP